MYQGHGAVSGLQDETTLYTPLPLDEAPHPSLVPTSICNPQISYEVSTCVTSYLTLVFS